MKTKLSLRGGVFRLPMSRQNCRRLVTNVTDWRNAKPDPVSGTHTHTCRRWSIVRHSAPDLHGGHVIAVVVVVLRRRGYVIRPTVIFIAESVFRPVGVQSPEILQILAVKLVVVDVHLANSRQKKNQKKTKNPLTP